MIAFRWFLIGVGFGWFTSAMYFLWRWERPMRGDGQGFGEWVTSRFAMGVIVVVAVIWVGIMTVGGWIERLLFKPKGARR